VLFRRLRLSPSAFSHSSNRLPRLVSVNGSYAPVFDREDSWHCLAALRLFADDQGRESALAAETNGEESALVYPREIAPRS
jgi:hypothetical protein